MQISRVHVAGFGATLTLTNMKAFNEEFIIVSQRLGRAVFSLVLATQCLVFVVGVFIVAASLSRHAIFLLAGVESSRPGALVIVVATVPRSADEARSVGHSAAVENLQGLTEDSSRGRRSSVSTSDTVSFTALRLFSETKV